MHKTTRMSRREKRYFKEIGWLLLVKIFLIVAIRLIFFSHPEGKPDGVVITSAHLLGVTQSPEAHLKSSENRSSYDQ